MASRPSVKWKTVPASKRNPQAGASPNSQALVGPCSLFALPWVFDEERQEVKTVVAIRFPGALGNSINKLSGSPPDRRRRHPCTRLCIKHRSQRNPRAGLELLHVTSQVVRLPAHVLYSKPFDFHATTLMMTGFSAPPRAPVRTS